MYKDICQTIRNMKKNRKKWHFFSERKENCHVRLNFMIFFTKQKNPQIAEDSEFNRRSNSRVNQLLVNSLMWQPWLREWRMMDNNPQYQHWACTCTHILCAHTHMEIYSHIHNVLASFLLLPLKMTKIQHGKEKVDFSLHFKAHH